MGDVDWIALIWTLPALIGTGVVARVWWGAVASVFYAEARDEPESRYLIARDQFVTRSFSLVILTDVSVVGLAAMFGSGSLARAVVLIGLVALPTLLATKEVLSQRNWTRIDQRIEAEQRKDTTP